MVTHRTVAETLLHLVGVGRLGQVICFPQDLVYSCIKFGYNTNLSEWYEK